MRLNALLLCILPMLIATQAFATTQTVNPNNGDGNTELINAIQGANPGDTISLGAGTFNVSQSINVPTGVTITSLNNQLGTAHVVFSLVGTNGSAYGFVLNANDSDVSIIYLDLWSSNGLIQMSNYGHYHDIIIQQDNLQFGGGSLTDGSFIYGISVTIPNDELLVEHNYFHDSPNSNRNWCVFSTANSRFDYNLFYYVNDGGQIEDPAGQIEFKYNYGTYIHRMGQEVALDTACPLYDCEYNTFYDYVKPYNDTEGVSIVLASQKVIIANNFFDAETPPIGGWGVQVEGATGGPNRYGYAIEATGNSQSAVYNNTLIGPWAEDVSSDIANLSVYGNIVFGTALWGAFEGEPGPFGYGSINLTTGSPNSVDNNVSDAPPPPANTYGAGPDNAPITNSAPAGLGGSSGSGGSGSSIGSGSGSGSGSSGGSTGGSSGGSTGGSTGGTTGGTTTLPDANNPPLPLTGVVVTVQDTTDCTVSWTEPNSVNITGVTINIISTIGRQNFKPVTGTGSNPSVQIGGMHPGWLIDFTVTVTDSSGQTYTSKPVTASFPGNSLAPWNGTLWGGISVLQTEPPSWLPQ